MRAKYKKVWHPPFSRTSPSAPPPNARTRARVQESGDALRIPRLPESMAMAGGSACGVAWGRVAMRGARGTDIRAELERAAARDDPLWKRFKTSGAGPRARGLAGSCKRPGGGGHACRLRVPRRRGADGAHSVRVSARAAAAWACVGEGGCRLTRRARAGTPRLRCRTRCTQMSSPPCARWRQRSLTVR